MPNGLDLGMTAHYPGSVSDFGILQRNRDWHLKKLAKSGLEKVGTFGEAECEVSANVGPSYGQRIPRGARNISGSNAFEQAE